LTDNLLQEFRDRPSGGLRPGPKVTADELARRLGSKDATERRHAAWPLVRDAVVRLEFYQNAPVKSVLEIPIDDPDLQAGCAGLTQAVADAVAGHVEGVLAKSPAARQLRPAETGLAAIFDQRPADVLHPGLKLGTEELLDRLSNPDYARDDLLKTFWGLVRGASLRVKFYQNTPVKAEFDLPLSDPALLASCPTLFEAAASASLGALEEACLKTLVANNPGGRPVRI
jgi:hypothetical protein